MLITKALIEIPPRFAGMPPVNPESRVKLDYDRKWSAAEGLAEDIRYYGRWMRDEAEKRIGHLYPKAKLPDGSEATVVAWLWARTVKCPNPACGLDTPLLSSFVLSSRPGRERYLCPVVGSNGLRFEIRSTFARQQGDPRKGLKRGMSGIFACAYCDTVTTRDYVAAQGVAGALGVIQTAVVAEGVRSRLYLGAEAAPVDLGELPDMNLEGLEIPLSPNPRDVWCRNFGLSTPADLFTKRQLATLTTYSELVQEARDRTYQDARASWSQGDGVGLAEGGADVVAYADALAVYLACAASNAADDLSALVTWRSGHGTGATRSTFARQALPMVWDFAEVNPFAGATGDIETSSMTVANVVSQLPATGVSQVTQRDATHAMAEHAQVLVSTDPPYYDNIGYADLSDFFYVWLRRSLRNVYPDLFSTLVTPKDQELVATSYRFSGSKREADRFFEDGLHKAFQRMLEGHNEGLPLTLFYAFKQAESEVGPGDRHGLPISTGWETMLSGLLGAGFSVTGTWPVRSERIQGLKGGINALASSIVLACRPRPKDAPMATRKEFLVALKKGLPDALRHLQRENIAPVDLAQAAIGPGMAVFSRFAKVMEADGSEMRVRDALALINQVLDETLAEQEAEFDPATRWALAWFDSRGTKEGPFGEAEVLSKAKDTSVGALAQDGFLVARAGKVRLLGWDELPGDWDPATDKRLTIWEVTHYLIRSHQNPEVGSERTAADLLKRIGHAMGETARDLAYRLYSISERKGWTKEALAYNALVVAWPEIARLAATGEGGAQTSLGV